MFTYVVRRLLLFIPTLVGATFLVFSLMYLAPISIEDVMIPPDGNMQPGARAERKAYLNARFGLDDPFLVQYGRWLNNVSPVGIPTWDFADPAVVEQRGERRAWREAVEKQFPNLGGQPLVDAVDAVEDLATAAGEIDFSPQAGDLKAGNPLKGSDLGYSFIFQRPSSELIAERLPVTLLLNLISTPIALLVSIVTGVWAAQHRGKWQDTLTGTLLLGLYSIPVIWAGVMLIGFLANEQFIRLFPASELYGLAAQQQPFFPSTGADGAFRPGFLLDATWHLVLPIVCLTYGQFAYLSKLARTGMLETLSADFVRTARAKGVSERKVIWQHAFRNTLGPLITALAGLLPAIIVGSVIVERIFTINGMGSLAVEALLRQDRELFLSLTAVTLVLTVVSYLLADLAYAAADPRVSYE